MRIDAVHLDAVPAVTLRMHPRLSVLHTDPATAERLGEVLTGLALDPATGLEVTARGPHARAVLLDVEVDRPRLVARRPEVDGGEPRTSEQVERALADLHAAEARHEALLAQRAARVAAATAAPGVSAGPSERPTRAEAAANLRRRLVGLLEELAAALARTEPVRDLALLERGTHLVDDLARTESLSGPTLRSLLGTIDAASGLGPRTVTDPDAMELAVQWQQLDDEAVRARTTFTGLAGPGDADGSAEAPASACADIGFAPAEPAALAALAEPAEPAALAAQDELEVVAAHERVAALAQSQPTRRRARRRWGRQLDAARAQEARVLAQAGFGDWHDYLRWRARSAAVPPVRGHEAELAQQESIRLRRAGLRARIVSYLGEDPGDAVVAALRARRREVEVPYGALAELGAAGSEEDELHAAQTAAEAARRAVTNAFAQADMASDAALPGANGVPLLLDGPTVVLDNRDLDAYLGSVVAASETGQVILISSDRRVASWAQLLAPQVGALVEPVYGP